MTKKITCTHLDIYTGREGMRRVIISNQDVIDLLLDLPLCLSLLPAPGSCHSRTLRLSSSSEPDSYTSLSFPLTHMREISPCVGSLVTGSETKISQMFFALFCSPITIGCLSATQGPTHKQKILQFLGHLKEDRMPPVMSLVVALWEMQAPGLERSPLVKPFTPMTLLDSLQTV